MVVQKHLFLDLHKDTLDPLENRPGDGGVTQRILIHSDRGVLPTSRRDLSCALCDLGR